MLIDSHHHLWAYSPEEYGWISDQMAVLRQDFLVHELGQIAAESHVDGFVAVQARQSIAETIALVDIAAQSPLILGVVGWAPLADQDCDKHLAALSQSPWLKGVRHVVQDEPDDRFLSGDAFNRGVAMLAEFGLVYDILIYGRQLPAAIEFADRHPGLPMVVDHIAKPTIDPKRFDDCWEADFRELARREHVMCKFSGVVTEIVRSDDAPAPDQWSTDQIRRYWDVALEAYTPARLMFGSDWPVCLLRTSHIRWLETVRELAAGLSDSEQEALFSGNATRFYRLDPA